MKILTAFVLGSLAMLATAVAAPPANNNFASAQSLSGLPTGASGTTVEATLEAGEQTPYNATDDTTVWYKWTAASTGWYRVRVTSTLLDSVLAVWEGTGLAGQRIVSAADVGFEGDAETCFVHVGAGQQIHIQVAGWGGDQGTFSLGIIATTGPTAMVNSFSFVPTSVNVTSSSQFVDINLGASATAGVNFGSLFLEHLGSGSLLGFASFGADELVAGDAFSGSYETVSVISQYSQPGLYRATLTLNLLNSTSVEFGWDRNFSLPVSVRSALLTVVNTGPVDLAPPSITVNNFAPTVVDVRSGAEVATLDLTIVDLLSGLDFAGIYIYDANGDEVAAEFITGLDAVAGDEFNGEYQVSVTIPGDGLTGVWFYEVFLVDLAGNVVNYDGIDQLFPSAGQEEGIFEVYDNGYDVWAAENGVGAPGDDDDGDQIINLMEYGSNMDPNVNLREYVTGTGVTGLPRIQLVGSGAGRHLQVTYVRRPAFENPGITYTVQFTNDVTGAWEDFSGTENVETDLLTGLENVTVDDTQLLPASNRRFARLKISQGGP